MADKKARFDFEWFTVSYRTVWGALAIIIVVASVIGYQNFFSKPAHNFSSQLKSMEMRIEGHTKSVRQNQELKKLHEEALSLIQNAWSAIANKNLPQAEIFIESCEKIIKNIESELDKIESQEAARIVRIEGSVKIKPAGDFRWIEAKLGTTLKEGDKIKASSNGSAEIEFSNKDRQTIMPGGMIEIYESRTNPETSGEQLTVRVSGAATAVATARKRKEGSYSRVLTNIAVVETGQEEAEFIVNPKETQTEVKMIKGEKALKVKTAKEEIALGPQEAAVAYEKGGFDIRKLPPPPVLIAPAPGQPLNFSDPQNVEVQLKWEVDPRASKYHLMLSNSSLFASTIVDKNDVKPDPKGVKLQGLKKGTYYWKLAAIDRTGFESEFTETRSFRIITEPTSATDAPPLEVVETVSLGTFLLIRGKTDAGCYLTINEKRFDVRDDGSFEALIKLDRLGENRLVVKSQNASGGQTTRVYTAYLEQ